MSRQSSPARAGRVPSSRPGAAGSDVAVDPDEAARQARAWLRSRQLLAAAARVMERDGTESVSMQALADEAGVSVGLIYRYFGGKDEILLAVIVDVLDAFATRVPEAIGAADPDPVARYAAAFGAYCSVIAEHRHAALLSYRESKNLDEQGRRRIQQLEVTTSEPLRALLREGIEAGLFRDVDVDLVAYDALLMAHGWALKHWYFERTLRFEDYVERQTSLLLSALLLPRHRRRYAGLLEPARS